MDGEPKEPADAVNVQSEEPRKFIRTFAADADALKKGGVPELMPYGDLSPEAGGGKPQTLESEIANIQLPEPAPLPPPESEPVPQPESEPQLGPILEPEPAPNASDAIDLPSIEVPLPPPEPEPAPELDSVSDEPPQLAVPGLSEPTLSPIETYSGDFSEHMRDADASAITVLAAQQDAPRQQVKTTGSSALANGIYIGLSIVLLFIGAAGAYGAYRYYERGHSPVVIAPTISAPIFVDERAEVSGSGATLERAIAQSVASPPPDGSVRLLYSTDATTTDNNIFIDLQLPAPGELVRNLTLTGSMAGVLTIAGHASPFFILPVTSYADTFAGMLDWEQTMPQSMALLFPSYSTAGTTTESVATSTAPAKEPVGTFTDRIVANHNTREYKDAQGRTIMLYGYWDQSTLVIARNEAAFTEIVNRLANSKSGSQ